MMDIAVDKFLAGLRDVGHRAGLPRFWRWWMAELAPLVPAAPRSEIQRRRTRPVLEFGEGEAILWRPELVGTTTRLAELARVTLSGDAAIVAEAGRAAIAALRSWNGGGPSARPRIAVALAPRQVLRKELVLPAAVEENLHRTLAYDLDRHTPFRPEQLYFDASVVGRDVAKRTIRVQWAAALRNVVDAARKQAEEWGATVVAVVPGPASIGRLRLNLLPENERPRPMLWRRWQVWVPAALVAVCALAVVFVPLVQKREYTIALMRQTGEAKGQAEVVDALRREFERQQSDYNYVLSKKYSWPGTVQILDDVTKVLPDDTWITQFEMKTTTKAKEVQREVFLRGESANAGKLISLLEDSRLVDQVVLRSPTTKLQPGPGEVFDLGGVLRALAPPSAVEASASAPMPALTEASATAGSASTVPPGTTAAPAPASAPPLVAPAAPAPGSAAPPATAVSSAPAPAAPPNAAASAVPASGAAPSSPAAAKPPGNAGAVNPGMAAGAASGSK
jgi:general secretion pathway protein L